MDMKLNCQKTMVALKQIQETKVAQYRNQESRIVCKES